MAASEPSASAITSRALVPMLPVEPRIATFLSGAAIWDQGNRKERRGPCEGIESLPQLLRKRQIANVVSDCPLARH